MSEIKTFLLTIKTSLLSAISLRESFLLQSLLLLLSNFIFFSFWWIYFDQFNSVRGWTLSDMACLYGIVNGAYGLFSVFLGGSRYISRMIFEGDLDALIVKPKNLLFQIMGSKSISSGWGDIGSSVLFLYFSGYLNLKTFPLIILLILTSCLIIAAFSIITGSLAFWIENSHALSKQLFEFLLTFSNYPKSIFVGGIKFFLMTVIPSGFIGFVPIEIINQFTFDNLLMIVGFCTVYFYLSVKIFYFGLNYYSSGNKSGFKV